MHCPDSHRPRGFRLFLLLSGVGLGVAGCGDDAGTGQSPPVATVVILPHGDSLEIGESVQLGVRTLDARGDTLLGRAITWSSGDTAIVRVNGAGLLTGRAVGSTVVVATSEGIDGTTSSRVVVAAVATIAMSPAADTVALNGVTQYTVILRDARNVVLTGRPVSWTTSSGSVAQVSPSGQVSAQGLGSVTVVATVEGKSATALFTVLRSFASMHPAGFSHSCGLTAAGEAWCWGWNAFGSLGTGIPADSPLPVPVAGSLAFTQLTAAGWSGHTCGLIAGGQAFCWGSARSGQLGDGTGNGFQGTDRFMPEPVSGGLSFTSLAAGGGRTCGVAADGSTYCWGRAIGSGTQVYNNAPTLVGGAVPLVGAVVGQDDYRGFACGLTSGGAAYCWGANDFGQLGVGDTLDRVVPVAILGGHSFTELAAGVYHTCGLTAAGSIYCWGSNFVGQLGSGRFSRRELVPVALASTLTFTSMTAGSLHGCGMTNAGLAFCWGSNSRGSLGVRGGFSSTPSPTPVDGGLTFKSLSANGSSSCGIATDELAYCWGENSYGVLGNGISGDPNSIVVVDQPGKVVFR